MQRDNGAMESGSKSQYGVYTNVDPVRAARVALQGASRRVRIRCSQPQGLVSASDGPYDVRATLAYMRHGEAIHASSQAFRVHVDNEGLAGEEWRRLNEDFERERGNNTEFNTVYQVCLAQP